MTDTKPVIIDTRDNERDHTLQLITTEHPEGIIFTIHPLRSATFLKIVDKIQKLQSLKAKGVQLDGVKLVAEEEKLYSLLTPLVEPRAEFEQWAEDAKENVPLAYHKVMQTILGFLNTSTPTTNE